MAIETSEDCPEVSQFILKGVSECFSLFGVVSHTWCGVLHGLQILMFKAILSRNIGNSSAKKVNF